jgi:hypothetical protein
MNLFVSNSGCNSYYCCIAIWGVWYLVADWLNALSLSGLRLIDGVEKIKASMHAVAERPFRVIKLNF